jgi:CheY-like chemotaxis protein
MNEATHMNATPKRTPTVLIVDDFEDNRQMYAEFLTFSGFQVFQAVDGEDAVAKATELVPDLVVMDMSLPVLDGWEATRRIKGNPRTRHIPVVALTGHAMEAGSDRFPGGCDEFLAKPCLPEKLVDTLTHMLANTGQRS